MLKNKNKRKDVKSLIASLRPSRKDAKSLAKSLTQSHYQGERVRKQVE
jgi:hypothetical protein